MPNLNRDVPWVSLPNSQVIMSLLGDDCSSHGPLSSRTKRRIMPRKWEVA